MALHHEDPFNDDMTDMFRDIIKRKLTDGE